jgi:hypothetical protein
MPIADLHTLLEEDLKAVGEPLSFRAIQFLLICQRIAWEDGTVQLVQHALSYAKEFSAPPFGG